MATSNDELRRAVKPGDIVVSLSEIVNRLQSLVSPGVLDGLLGDIVANRRSEVRPGQVITATLMNQVLRQLESLEVRIANLEARVTIGSRLELTKIEPSGTLRVGQVIQAIGSNFGYTSKSVQVTIGGILVTQFDINRSNDNLLIFTIPNITVSADGAEVVLKISNGSQSAEQRVTILPANIFQSSNASINYKKVVPNTISPGDRNPVRFEFNLSSNTLLDETYLITPAIDISENRDEWQRSLRITDAQGGPLPDRRISIGSGKNADFIVELMQVPLTPSNGTFSLTVNASSRNVALVSHGPRQFQIGEQIPEENSNVTVQSVLAVPPNALNGTTITSKLSEPPLIRVFLSIDEIGTYELSVNLNDLVNWRVEIEDAEIFADTKPYVTVVEFYPIPETNPSDSGQMEILVTNSQTRRQKKIPFVLALGN